MLRIRLQRKGARRKAQHAIVVMEHRLPTDGRVLEKLGTYNALQDPPAIRVERERVEYWVRHGAQMSPTVAKLLKAHARYHQA